MILSSLLVISCGKKKGQRKKMRKSLLLTFIISILALAIAGCSATSNNGSVDNMEQAAENTDISTENSVSKVEAEEADPIYIVYTNDIHSYIYNTVKDENGENKPGLRMSNIAAMISDMKAEGKNVILVDAGDELQGDVYGAFDEGESVIELMNACGYNLATPGNHDFDFGMNAFFNRIEEADYPYISCNFHALIGDEDPLNASHIFTIGGKKIAFIGITTPEAITSSTPTYFQNEKGEYIYTIDGVDGAVDMYVGVQNVIDKVKEEVDYVIAIGHVGVGIDEKRNSISSYDVIANVEGLDAFIDGHSHTVMEKELVKDKSGKEVVLTQTGSYLDNVGLMEIDGDTITTSLISSYDRADVDVVSIEDEINNRIMERMGEKVAKLSTTMYINSPDDTAKRLIRSREMNSGDMISDSVYWYFNEVLDIDCDVAITNGGGIRAQLNSGDVTYMDIKSVEPFGNMICLINATGQQILDALEMGTTVMGEWDDAWDIPAENGGFLHVAGMQYTIDSTIPSSVITKGDGMFESVDGAYRVKDVKIYNKETQEYDDMDLEKTYAVGGINYLLRNNGNGLNMFSNDEMVIDFVGQDYSILAMYFEAFKKDGDYPLVNTKNSPLNSLSGYQIDYENPYGAGRINVILE